jgi:WD40 repeat protein
MQHQGPIAGIAAHGDYIATAGYDNKLILWDAHQHKALARGTHDHLVNHCAFSADGRWLLSASSDYTARLWALPSLKLHAVLTGHADDVDMAVFSPDDRLIATCALDRLVRIFDLNGKCLHTLQGHTGNVLSVAWTADSRYVVSSSVDGTIRQWYAEQGIEVQCTDLKVRTDSVEIGLDGTIYAGDDLGRIAIISNHALQYVQAHGAGIKKIALDVARGRLVSLSYDRSMIVWQLDNENQLRAIASTTLPETIWARAACILEDGRIAAGTFGSTYALFDPASLSWDVQGVEAGSAINAVLNVNNQIYSVGDAGIVSIDGKPAAEMGSLCNLLVAANERVLTGGQMGCLFDAHTGAVLYRHHSPLNCGVAFKRNLVPHIAIGCYTGEILIFSFAKNGTLEKIAELKMYENAVKGLSCSEGVLFSVCASTDIAWHKVEDFSLIKQVSKAHERITNACCSIGNKNFASVGRDRTLRLWGNEKATAYPSPHLNSVKCISANDDYTAVLTGSYGGTLAMFDLKNRQWKSFERPTTSGISSITWDGIHQRFLAASYDGQIYAMQT